MSPLAVIVAATLAGVPVPVASNALTVPPVMIDVATASDVSPMVVSIAMEEMQALFRSAGVRFIWRLGVHPAGALRVVFSAETGPAREHTMPLGWLNFENGQPMREIHLSYANAERFMEDSREVVGIVSQKTLAEKYRLLGRALGRALAHELGHYLLATTNHTPKGLLKGRRTAQEFFSVDRTPFAMDLAEKRQVAASVLKEVDLVRRQN
jgi:hypothetical protein